MKVELKKHISEVLSSLQISISFEVFDCNNDILPEWTEKVQLTHEYLVCCGETAEIKRIQSFIGKTIFQIDNHIYWFDGNRTRPLEISQFEDLIKSREQKIDYLKTKTTLPAWLDDFIFDHLKAVYAPDFKKFDYNLNLTKEDNLKYLGTYFPRSYTESFCVFDNIFQNTDYLNTFSEKKPLNILSVGCGTGGDLMGLLIVIEKYCHKISDIQIWAIDGNKESLVILKKIIKQFSIQTLKKIELNAIESIFDSIEDINIEQIKKCAFDFILSFKMICEIISIAETSFYKDSYYKFVIKFAPLLSSNGLCLLLDVTTKTGHNNSFNPILMNQQVNQALLELKGFQTLLPLPCNFHEHVCVKQCFTQQKFQVSHKQKTNDISKVCYRVIGKAEFVNTLVNDKENAKYLIQKDKQAMMTAFCPHSNGEKIIDGYKLNNS